MFSTLNIYTVSLCELLSIHGKDTVDVCFIEHMEVTAYLVSY